MQRYRLDVNGFPIILEVKRVKGLRLRVSEHGVFMSVPPGTPAETCRRFALENLEWIRKSLKKQLAHLNRSSELTEEKARRFTEEFKPRFEAWQRRMNLACRSVTFKIMSSRWGSCNYATKKISINLKLALYPPECTDYVIVHELAHLVHPNHSAAFWQFVGTHLPNWRSLRSKLRQ